MLTMTKLNFDLTCYALRCWVHDRVRSERGEGVISAAIAVLIVAFLGAAMWVAFNAMWKSSETKIRDNVEQIGN